MAEVNIKTKKDHPLDEDSLVLYLNTLTKKIITKITA